LPQQRRERTRQQLEIAGRATGALPRGLARLAGIVEPRLRAEERRHVTQPRHAVHHRVVQLRDHREAAVRETLDDDQLPQRPAAVEGSLVDLGGQRGDFPRAAGARNGRPTHVKLEIEIRLFDPQGPGQPEGHLEQPPSQRRHEVEPSCDELPEAAERVATGNRLRVEDQHRHHVEPVPGQLRG
jgi:hypothetical protein